MHQMRLVPDPPFYNSCDVTVYHVREDGTEKKRCKITVEYGEYDIRQLQERGCDYEAALTYFEDRIYNTVKLYIADDWEYAGGYDEIMAIIEGHIRKYFYKEQQEK